MEPTTIKTDFFEQLCVAQYQAILRYLCHTLGSREVADEVAQEVFLTACRRRELLCQHPNPAGWLFLTARTLAQKHRRLAAQRFLRELTLDGDVPPPLADPAATVEAQLDAAIDETTFVEGIVAQLSPEKQQLYRFYYLEGMTMAQVAARLGLEETTLRMRYVRLRRELRGLVAQLAEREFSV